jgi:uncharacterized membrane protein YjjB (DUF3815 family)
MTEDQTRSALAILIILGFLGFLTLVLWGVVLIEQPEMAKFVGAAFGFLGGLVTNVLFRYFKEPPP